VLAEAAVGLVFGGAVVEPVLGRSTDTDGMFTETGGTVTDGATFTAGVVTFTEGVVTLAEAPRPVPTDTDAGAVPMLGVGTVVGDEAAGWFGGVVVPTEIGTVGSVTETVVDTFTAGGAVPTETLCSSVDKAAAMLAETVFRIVVAGSRRRAGTSVRPVPPAERVVPVPGDAVPPPPVGLSAGDPPSPAGAGPLGGVEL
jgi:hypothetical protein